MNKFNKGKLVGIIAASLSAVSLMGVGFATWIVGVKQTNASNDINITADSVEYKSIIVGVTFNEDLKLAETAATTNKYFNSNAADGKLSIKTTFSFTLGKNFDAADFDFTKIRFSIASDSALNNKPTDKQVHLSTREYNDTLTYFNLPADEDITFDNLNKDENQVDLTKTYTVERTLKFTWGFMFGNEGKSPCTYYEEEINKTTVENKDTFMKQAGQELEDMNAKYSTGKLKLKMELVHA